MTVNRTARDAAAAALWDRWQDPDGAPGVRIYDDPRAVAQVVLDAALPHIAEQVLQDAAHAWQWGEWADAPRCADRVQERIANAQYVGDWLRARAGQPRKDERPADGELALDPSETAKD